MRTPSLLLLLVAFVALPACQTTEDVAETTADTAEDAAETTERVARGAADAAEDAADTAVESAVDVGQAAADLAGDAYDEARDVLGVSRVPDDARVAVARVSAPADTSTGVTGTVTFVELTDGVRVRYDLAGLESGQHGFHIHETGSCAAADSDGDGYAEAGGAAGGHLNPQDNGHGGPDENRADRHAGDLGNVEAGADGRVTGAKNDDVLSFSGPTSVVGKAVMVHAQRDDLETDPGGTAGGRVGCGVIMEADRM